MNKILGNKNMKTHKKKREYLNIIIILFVSLYLKLWFEKI